MAYGSTELLSAEKFLAQVWIFFFFGRAGFCLFVYVCVCVIVLCVMGFCVVVGVRYVSVDVKVVG